MDNWISVKDRLPELNKQVLIRGWGEGNRHYIFSLGSYQAYYDNKTWFDDQDDKLHFQVVDWMPLPAPPRKA